MNYPLYPPHPFFTLGTSVCMTCGCGRLGWKHTNVPESMGEAEENRDEED